MAPLRTLIDAAALQALLARPGGDAPAVVVLDCRFDLADPAAGARAHAESRIAGSRYAHLDDDLAGPKTGRNGRHPLPSREAFAATLGRWGVGPASQVVAVDDHGGAYAARAWWMLRWMGHEAVAVLDGGLAAWRAAGGALVSGPPEPVPPASPYPVAAQASMPVIDAAALQRRLGHGVLLDARSGERFRGEVEPLDPVAGHIPGATLRCFKDNLGPDGRFRPAPELRRAFDALGVPAKDIVHQCGSGVTACHNLLAMVHAGLEGSTLYPGSWSEWCADPSRPVAVG